MDIDYKSLIENISDGLYLVDPDRHIIYWNKVAEKITGYRADDLDWNIAGDINGNNPNVLSELTWDDVKSYQVKLQGSAVWPNRESSTPNT